MMVLTKLKIFNLKIVKLIYNLDLNLFKSPKPTNVDWHLQTSLGGLFNILSSLGILHFFNPWNDVKSKPTITKASLVDKNIFLLGSYSLANHNG
jgi:hypothetical protein